MRADERGLALPCDYDTDPQRSRSEPKNIAYLNPKGPRDVHQPVAARLVEEGLEPILDVGCGRGRLARELPASVSRIGVDQSPAQLAEAPSPVIRGDARHLPIRNDSMGAVAALWMLYHLEHPVQAIAEAYRVLRPGGLFVACTNRRDDSPEVIPRQRVSTFDAEDAPALVAEVFGDVELVPWDEPMFTLLDEDAVRAFLIGQLGDLALADGVQTPVTVTKRGCLVWARKR